MQERALLFRSRSVSISRLAMRRPLVRPVGAIKKFPTRAEAFYFRACFWKFREPVLVSSGRLGSFWTSDINSR